MSSLLIRFKKGDRVCAHSDFQYFAKMLREFTRDLIIGLMFKPSNFTLRKPTKS